MLTVFGSSKRLLVQPVSCLGEGWGNTLARHARLLTAWVLDSHALSHARSVVAVTWSILGEKKNGLYQCVAKGRASIRIHEPVVAQRHTAQAHWSNTELALIEKSFRSVNSSNSWACCGSAAYGTGALESYGALIEKSFRPVNVSNSWACYYSAAYGTGALEGGQMTKKSADLDLSISKKSDYDITHLLLLELA